MIAKSPTERFTDRVDNYIKFRPGYPDELYNFIIKEFSINNDSLIADIGSGTGIFAEPLLKKGLNVYCVEPNSEMRKAAEKILSSYTNFKSINGTAESTTLTDKFADVIIAAQAFHWFDIEKCREEFVRIRKYETTPVILIWNERKVTTDFLKEYEELLLKFSEDYSKVDHRNIDRKKLNRFYGNDNWDMKTFDNFQDFDLESFKGRVFSSSYVPAKDEKGYEDIEKGLVIIYEKYNENGMVRFKYDTNVYWGEIEFRD